MICRLIGSILFRSVLKGKNKTINLYKKHNGDTKNTRFQRKFAEVYQSPRV